MHSFISTEAIQNALYDEEIQRSIKALPYDIFFDEYIQPLEERISIALNIILDDYICDILPGGISYDAETPIGRYPPSEASFLECFCRTDLYKWIQMLHKLMDYEQAEIYGYHLHILTILKDKLSKYKSRYEPGYITTTPYTYKNWGILPPPAERSTYEWR